MDQKWKKIPTFDLRKLISKNKRKTLKRSAVKNGQFQESAEFRRYSVTQNGFIGARKTVKKFAVALYSQFHLDGKFVHDKWISEFNLLELLLISPTFHHKLRLFSKPISINKTSSERSVKISKGLCVFHTHLSCIYLNFNIFKHFK